MLGLHFVLGVIPAQQGAKLVVWALARARNPRHKNSRPVLSCGIAKGHKSHDAVTGLRPTAAQHMTLPAGSISLRP